MEARPLTPGLFGGRAGRREREAAWFAPLRSWMAASDPRDAGQLDLGLLNGFATARGLRTEDGLRLRFVDARSAPRGGYERVIREHGTVPTRASGAGMLHDWFNALAWLAWPRIKARLNRLQSDAIAAATSDVRRGPLGDAATLFDENGALFVCGDPALTDCLRRRDWLALFVEGRERFARAAAVHVVGHGLGEKLLAPYKALCAHAWIVEAPAIAPNDVLNGDALDEAASAALQPATLRAASLCPLPLLGVPHWWPANADPAFYDDPQVFRPGKRMRPGVRRGAARTASAS